MTISLIVALDRRNAIGFNGDQLAYISDDLKHFKAITQHHTIVMGRKTSDALPKGILPNRRNIVLTHDKRWQREGAETACEVEEVLEMVRHDGEVFVIGGGVIYEAFMPHASHLYITHIDHTFPNVDTFFPDIDNRRWKEIPEKSSEMFTDEKSGLKYCFKEYELK